MHCGRAVLRERDLIQEKVSLPQPARDDLFGGTHHRGLQLYHGLQLQPSLPPGAGDGPGGKARLAVRRQTFADLVACDL